MISAASQVAQFRDLPNYKSKSTSVVLCVVCGDVQSSVLSYHKHNVTKHSSYELSCAIIKLCGLQIGQISFRINDNNQSYIVKESSPKQMCVSNGIITDTNFEYDSLFPPKKKETFTSKDTKENKEEKMHSSREEIWQEKELINNITNTLQNQDGKKKELESNFKYAEPENRTEDITCISFVKQNQKDSITSSNNGMGVTPVAKDVQYTNNIYLTENEKYKINEKDIRVRIKKRKCISKTMNEGNDLYECNDFYECNEVVHSKGIKLEEEILRGMNDNETTNNEERNQDLSLSTNFDLNISDSLITDEVFLQPHSYTEEANPHMSQSYHSFHPSNQEENLLKVHSNNTFPKYEHSKIMHQSENELVDDYDLISISGSELSKDNDIHLATHSPIIEAFSTPEKSLASLIFLILQNSVEGLPVSILYALLQSLFPYFFQKCYYSYTSSDWINLIRKILRKEKGFKKIKRKGMAHNDTVWETTSIIAKYEEEIQNSSHLEDFTQSSELLKALKMREVKFDINGNNLSPIHSPSFIFHSSCNSQNQKLLGYQEDKVEEGRTTFKQGYTDHSQEPLDSIYNQESFNINNYSRSNEAENVLRNNNNSALLNDLIHMQSDLKGIEQNISTKNTIVNIHNVGILKPERKNYKSKQSDTKNLPLRDSQIDLLMEESFVSNLENSDEWEIDYIEVKTEPVSWCEEGDYSHRNLIYEDVECNDYIYNDEKFSDINTESSNYSSESNESTFENETNFGLDNYKGREISENIFLPNVLLGKNCASIEESLQQSIQQLIPCKKRDSNRAKKSSQMENNDNFHTTNKRRKKKQSSIKSNEWLPRNRTKHRMNEKMRRMELNQQFDNLLKRLPEYGQGRSLPKTELLNRAKKYVSKLEKVNNKLLKTKESLEEYQQKLINTLSKSD